MGHYAKNREVASSILDEVIAFFGAYNRSEYQESSWAEAHQVRKADILTAVCEQIV
jgi:hypothetical protein